MSQNFYFCMLFAQNIQIKKVLMNKNDINTFIINFIIN